LWQAGHADAAEIRIGGVGIEMDRDAVFRKQFGKTLAPFDEDDGFAIEDFIEAQRGDVGGALEPVEINVISGVVIRLRTVFVDQGERRAGDFIGLGRTEPAHDAFRERGLSCAEIPDEQHDGATRQHARDAAAQFDGLLVTGGVKLEGCIGFRQSTRIVAR
jgi:hypothetical protein